MMPEPIPEFMIYMLLAGYVSCVVGLNLICYMISGFYQRKFREYSPRIGYMTSLIAGLVFAFLLIIDGKSLPVPVKIVQIFSLAVAGVASVWNSVSLYYTMKRVRK